MGSTTKRRLLVTAAGMAALLVTAAVAGGTSGDRTKTVKRQLDNGRAKNVILLIGDGMGESEITLARNYAYGAGGRLPGIDEVPLTGDITTYSLLESNPALPDYVPDSAATGTAWATGSKTSNGRVNTAAGTDADLARTLLQKAKAKGLATGNVSTAEITDATPAVQFAHVTTRSCQGPADMSGCPLDAKQSGGPGSIAEQAIDGGFDVILGGGRNRFLQTVQGGPFAGQTVVQQAQAKGYQYVTDRAGLLGTAKGKKTLGLFTGGNMSLEWGGTPAQNPASGPQTCLENQRPATEPSLAEMETQALRLLQSARHRKKGFFLQVEGASIDKQDHAAAPCQQIGETIAFDQAVQVARAFAKKHRDTLVIVTADHAHTSQIVEVGSVVPGLASVLNTREGGQMEVSYGTAVPPASQEHTGATVRVAAQGPQAANLIGLHDQTEINRVIKRALGL